MLINCVAYEEGRKLADIEKRDIRNYLQRPGCFVWVALRDATDDELAEMQDEFDLHPLAVEDARHGHQRPKIEEYGDLLFVVVNTVEVVGDELKVAVLTTTNSRSLKRLRYWRASARTASVAASVTSERSARRATVRPT